MNIPSVTDGTWDGERRLNWEFVKLVVVVAFLATGVGVLVWLGIATEWWVPLAVLAVTPIGWIVVGLLGWQVFLAIERKVRG